MRLIDTVNKTPTKAYRKVARRNLKCIDDAGEVKWQMELIWCTFFFHSLILFPTPSHLSLLLPFCHFFEQQIAECECIRTKKQCKNKLILAIIPFEWKLCKLISELEMKKRFFLLVCPRASDITSYRPAAFFICLISMFCRFMTLKQNQNEKRRMMTTNDDARTQKSGIKWN